MVIIGSAVLQPPRRVAHILSRRVQQFWAWQGIRPPCPPVGGSAAAVAVVPDGLLTVEVHGPDAGVVVDASEAR